MKIKTTHLFLLQILFLSLVSALPAQADITTGLAGHWNLNEGTGTLAQDSSTGANPLILKNGVLWSSGVQEKAVWLDGINDILVPQNPKAGIFHNSFTNKTVSLWVTVEGLSEIQAAYEQGGSTNSFAIGYRKSTNKILFVTLQNKKKTEISSTTNQWGAAFAHVTAVYNNGSMKLYINGQEEASGVNGTVIPSHSDNPGIGGRTGSSGLGSKSTVKGWKGKIDNVRIYNRSLSASDILELYNAEKETSPADTTAPTVSMSAPANNATISGSSVAVSANASDNVGVVGVQFKLDGNNLGSEDATSPYSVVLNTTALTNDAHTLRAVARDAAGNSTTSVTINVTVNNPVPDTTSPTVSMTAPANNATISGASVNVTANASDNVGVVGVQFKLDGNNLGSEDTTSPYSVILNSTALTNDAHTLRAVARDAAGNSTTSVTINVTVNNPVPDTTAPTVAISAPANNATVSGNAVTVSANASDNVGVIGVQFKLDGNNLGSEDTTSPYSVVLNSTTLTNAAHTLTAVARDAAGNSTTSAVVTVNVNNATPPPLPIGGAPARVKPYTDPACSNPDVFFCEDFEGQDIYSSGNPGGQNTWGNPAFESTDVYWNIGGTHQRSTINLPGFDPASNHVWRISKSQGFTDLVTGVNTGTGSGTMSGWLKPAIMGTGAREWYTRIQVYFHTDHTWPSDYDFKMFFALPRTFIDPPSAAYETGMTFHQDFWCNPPNANFNDVPAIRYSSNFRHFPYQNEYCPPLQPGQDANGTNAPRVQKGRWYTLEYHAKLASDNTGILEMWVDGKKAYQYNGITCHNGCADMGYIMIMGWMNGADQQTGYYEIDNVVMSRKYIGLPAGSTPPPPADTTAPTVSMTAPANNASVSGASVNVSANASDNVGVVGVQFKLDGNNLGSEDLTSPYSVVLNSTTLTNAAHTLTAVARDAAGNSTTSTVVTINVNNVTPPPPPPAGNGVIFNAAANSPDMSNQTDASWSHTTSGANRYLLVGLGGWDNTDSLANVFVTYNGVAMSKLGGAQTPGSNQAILWGLANPALGTNFVTISNIPAGFEELGGGSISFTEVHQTISTGTLVNEEWPGSDGSVDITLSSGDIGVDIFYSGAGAQEPVIGSNGTKRVNANLSNSAKWMMMGTEGGAGTVAMSWTDAGGSDFAQASIPIKFGASGPSDTVSPMVSISAPANNATVSGSTVAVSANASDNVGVAGVQFKLDGNNLGSEDTSSPYSVNWDSTSAANGSHSLTAVVRDAAGNTTTSSGINVSVNNPVVPDATAPSISISGPADNATVSGANVSVSANATDNVGVVGVQFRMDSNNLGAEDLTSPYSVIWNSMTATNGSHSLSAIARDAAGNLANSGTINITVNNSITDTTAPSVPVNLMVHVISASQLHVMWNASTDNVGVSSYRLERCTGSSCTNFVQLSSPTNTEFADNGLAMATTYRYRVRAADAAGNLSGYSSILNGTTQAASSSNPPTFAMHHDTIPNFATSPTIVSAANGNWSLASTWSPARVPASTDIVYITHAVTYDSQNGDADAIGIAPGGALRFSTTQSTRLMVANLIVQPQGTLEVGTESNPVLANLTAQIIIKDKPISLSIDPDQYGTGIIVIDGTVSFYGAAKIPTFVRTAVEPRAGHTTLSLEQSVSGWKVGDRIFLPDTRQVDADNWFNANYALQVEERTIQNISPDGKTITLSSGLTFDHRGARDANGTPTVLSNGIKLLPHVGNLSRNVVIRSENPNGTRGHTLFTNRAAVKIGYTQFQDLGRTKAIPLNRSTNHIGRYPLHMHHVSGPVNPSNTGYQYQLIGNAINDSLKWPMAIHGTHFGLIKQNVIFGGNQLTGAGIALEDGSETENLIEANFVANIRGNINPRNSGPDTADGSTPGAAAECFWAAGFNNRYVNNVATDCRNPQQQIVSGPGWKFIVSPAPYTARNPRFRGADLMNTSQTISVIPNLQPILEFRDNEVYGLASDGLTIWELGNPYGCCDVSSAIGETVIKDFRVWHTYEGAIYNYPTNRLTVDGLVYRVDEAASLYWPTAFQCGDYRCVDITIRGGSIHAGSVFTGTTDPIGSFLFENIDATTRYHAFNFETPATPGTQADRPASGVTMTLRNNRISAWPGQPLRTISMDHRLDRGNSQPNDNYDILINDYQRQAGNNFQAYFAVQATQNLYGGLAPCTNTTAHPEIDGITCP